MAKNISYGSYLDSIKTQLKDYGYSTSKISNYLNQSEIKEFINSEYNTYISEDENDITSGGHSPSAVASCLDMMY